MVYKSVDANGKTKRIYLVWYGMKHRCFNSNDKDFKDYGGRGITVCEEWLDFSTFCEWAYSNGYDENKTGREQSLDRINVNGNYEPNNCRWVNMATQRRNTRTNVIVNGKCLQDVSKETGINPTTILRYTRDGVFDTSFKPRAYRATVEGKTLTEIANMSGISRDTIKWRYRHGAKTIAELTKPVRGV